MNAAAAIVLAAWIVLAALGTSGYSFAANRLKRRARATYTDLTLSRPEVPQPVAIDIPGDADAAEVERLVYAALFDEIMRPEFPEYRKDFTGGAA